ncbi:MAG TPA: CarD family transcriptional regulator [Candidatus Dojkabacteria bacterium]|nr:CarD family transcriptional regulator [Candidatus Dojkabacteria bacterium]
MENITKGLSKNLEEIKEEVLRTKKVSGIEPYLLEFSAELLGNILNKKVFLRDSGDNLQKRLFTIKKGDIFNISNLLDLGYTRVERVWCEGEISILGDVVVVWPFSTNNVLRISLLGEKIEEMAVVDSQTRKKIKDVNERVFVSEGSKIYLGNEDASDEEIIDIVPRVSEEEYVDLELRSIPGIENFSNPKALKEILKNFRSRKFKIWYITDKRERIEKLVQKDILEMIDQVFTEQRSISTRGFVSQRNEVVVLTDLEVLGEIDLSNFEKVNKGLDPNSIEILKKVTPGEYLVHEDHGIGKFVGVVEREKGFYIEISYAGEDKLYVPLSASEKLTKYIGAGKGKPILTGLNSGSWKRISQKASERAEEIAKELLMLYAMRETAQSVFTLEDEDRESFKTFVEQFEYTDTDDQILATEQIEQDFKRGRPMDRLLVGDVGFGKTEIAMRAMFPVVNSGFQVAFLAPTTILVQQHLTVLRERFKNYPFNIQSLSRFSTEADKKRVLHGLKNGVVDIVVGTHSLLSDDVQFKNLGLLVVDEEQKFGVKQKEKIKGMRINSNVLSLTATPIPRTLNMALMGVRDISVLAVPPSGRKDIVNSFEHFNWDSIVKAIQKEMDRGGQVYFLHNRIGNILSIQKKLQELFPKAVVDVVHGQMGSKYLSSRMSDFVSKKTDILLCTTIIENGLDIPNANTLIVDDASKLGLSQMYQIRGRVGRSLEQAYAYFFFDTLSENAVLRLDALRDSQSLGSGFLLSNRDLEIRGAGDILGKNQSGTINSVGYGLYTQMLSGAIEKIKARG